jgi:type III pantothenate kinase
MLLAIDVGNTNTVLGFLRGTEVLGSWRVSTNRMQTPDELGFRVKELCDIACGGLLEEISGVVICSVVPPLTSAYVRMSKEFLKLPPVVVRSDTEMDITIDYYDPTEVGADRLANAVAVHELVGGPVIVVDFGTATTFDVITAEGHYRGGAIAPGIRTSSENLFRRAALLHGVGMEAPDRVIGRSTDESLRAGILYGAVGQVDELVTRMTAELLEEPVVIATGGLAETIAPLSRTITRVEPDLTLKGLGIIYRRVTGE